ncbi:MAG: hypothetical protein LKK49_04180 [Leuconostoc mesenteroides]|jgi:hypothetical protein|nr:hypothetical protein [Leuconostoc mesenteroides]MCI2167247.1 hypothetical protein [Leuconostoc mesenteroides]
MIKKFETEKYIAFHKMIDAMLSGMENQGADNCESTAEIGDHVVKIKIEIY